MDEVIKYNNKFQQLNINEFEHEESACTKVDNCVCIKGVGRSWLS